jgi:hypothetical protein
MSHLIASQIQGSRAKCQKRAETKRVFHIMARQSTKMEENLHFKYLIRVGYVEYENFYNDRPKNNKLS